MLIEYSSSGGVPEDALALAAHVVADGDPPAELAVARQHLLEHVGDRLLLNGGALVVAFEAAAGRPVAQVHHRRRRQVDGAGAVVAVHLLFTIPIHKYIM